MKLNLYATHLKKEFMNNEIFKIYKYIKYYYGL
jgi:hypothetical protein